MSETELKRKAVAEIKEELSGSDEDSDSE